VSDPQVVALGGGHGLAVSLAALRQITPKLTAIVTVADDGGSSGRIRRQLPVLPPGDLRMALAALASQDSADAAWATAFQHRLSGTGDLAGHPVGNLLLTGLMDSLEDPVAALDIAGNLLGCVGRVLPMSCVPLQLAAKVSAPAGAANVRSAGPQDDVATSVIGQHAVAVSGGRVVAVGLVPPDAPACPEALAAIAEADVIVLGPGSWYSSVLPHVLLPEMRNALATTSARIVLTLNLVPQEGETDGFSPQRHIRVLRHYAPELHIDTVLADSLAVTDGDALEQAAAQCGASLLLTSVADSLDPALHDPTLLAQAYRTVFNAVAPLAAAARASTREIQWP
jgi:uncharacterized cofD-like protein